MSNLKSWSLTRFLLGAIPALCFSPVCLSHSHQVTRYSKTHHINDTLAPFDDQRMVYLRVRSAKCQWIEHYLVMLLEMSLIFHMLKLNLSRNDSNIAWYKTSIRQQINNLNDVVSLKPSFQLSSLLIAYKRPIATPRAPRPSAAPAAAV
jgi:hypothetical protein